MSHIEDNILLLTDSYKMGHYNQYPPKTQHIYSYFESRGGQFKHITFFGLQYILKKYLEGWVVSREKIEEAEALAFAHFGQRLFNKDGWEYILNKHGGRLPVSIKAVPEGKVIPCHNVLMTIENTDPKCFWLTNYLETLLVQAWYPCTVATQSRVMREILQKYLDRNGDAVVGIDFKLHDFGFRGVSSVETAAIGGAAHLINFRGTDTLAALTHILNYYNPYHNIPISGLSIPASEHSTITAWGQKNECLAMKNMLEQYPNGTIACVSDSFNIFNACENIWGGALKDLVLNRNGVLVIRPDSGNPAELLPSLLGILGQKFGTTLNSKGYKVLDPHVRLIQGDGIDLKSMELILQVLDDFGWSADNIAFGSGGGLLQKLNRDTCKFAFKCSSAVIDGEERDVYKDPVTDKGKRSKRGRLMLAHNNDEWNTYREEAKEDCKDELVEVFRDGRILKQYSFDDIRHNTKSWLVQQQREKMNGQNLCLDK